MPSGDASRGSSPEKKSEQRKICTVIYIYIIKHQPDKCLYIHTYMYILISNNIYIYIYIFTYTYTHC